MTKKRKRWPDLQQKLDRPWCYYCDRDFDDLKILISHQKAKHFKCERCGRRLNTAGVHKESLSHVENALPGKSGLELEIFGMEGVPVDDIERHNTDVTAKHFAEEEERSRISGNPARGLLSNGTGATSKQSGWKRQTMEEIKQTSEEFRIHKMNGTLPPRVDELPAPGPPVQAPGAPVPAFSPPVQGFPPPGAPGAPGFPPGQPFYNGPPPVGPPGLPQRPLSSGPPPGFPPFPARNGQAPPAANDLSASLDDLIADAKDAATGAAPAEGPPEKKAKKDKDKNINLVFFHETMSPEELMAQLPRHRMIKDQSADFALDLSVRTKDNETKDNDDVAMDDA